MVEEQRRDYPNILAKLASLQEGTEWIKNNLEKLNTTVFGNGQEGLISISHKLCSQQETILKHFETDKTILSDNTLICSEAKNFMKDFSTEKVRDQNYKFQKKMWIYNCIFLILMTLLNVFITSKTMNTKSIKPSINEIRN